MYDGWHNVVLSVRLTLTNTGGSEEDPAMVHSHLRFIRRELLRVFFFPSTQLQKQMGS